MFVVGSVYERLANLSCSGLEFGTQRLVEVRTGLSNLVGRSHRLHNFVIDKPKFC